MRVPIRYARQILEYALYRAIAFVVPLLPRRVAVAVGRRLGGLYCILDARGRRTGMENLRRVFPGEATELRDRGFLLAHLDRHGAAVADLESYLSQHPHAPDANAVRGRVAWLRKRITELN